MIYSLKSTNALIKFVRNSSSTWNNRSIYGVNAWNEEISNLTKHKIEEFWKGDINNHELDKKANSKEKYYVLSMFPYPSGNLHMGHVRVYTISDTIARYNRMNGKNVIHPIGWDAFGLPAENAAIDKQIAPHIWTQKNIEYMRSQLCQLGCSFEWDREINTCDPEYYKWTQELFLKLYDNNLVYQNEDIVNWDPIDKTVLADEQVDENGCSWRSGAKVEPKSLRQWFIRTTRFAKDLEDGLDDPVLDDWRDIIKLQKHWIGECDGVNFDFKIVNNDKLNFLTLWTPTPEYIKHAKFVAINETHNLAKEEGINVSNNTRKLNIELVNPFTHGRIPVFVTKEIAYLPFTNSYIGIPGISEESTNFAINHNISFIELPNFSLQHVSIDTQKEVCDEAKRLGIGGYWSSAKLKDWLISRQRYWGTPIPIIHCEKCGPQTVPRSQLPVTLPLLSNVSEKGNSQLTTWAEWINTKCPKCGQSAKRETDTMDTFVDSSWYYLRYLDSKNKNEMFDVNKINQMTPVDLYIGGKEHAVLHLYYARFINHFLHSLGLVPSREPFKKLLVQGMVMGRSFKLKNSGKYVHHNEVKILDSKKNKATLAKTGEAVVMTWEKMSKSKLNGVDPRDMFQEYGIDTTRLLILADVAPRSHRNWNSNTFPGILTWQRRLWLTLQNFLKYRNVIPEAIPENKFKEHDDYLFDSRNYYIKGTTFNYKISQQLSIAISKQQGLTNSIRKSPPYVYAKSLQFERALATQIILLSPMAPHFASELWSGFISAPHRLNNTDEIKWNEPVLIQTWPETDFNYQLDLVCQVNGIESCIAKLSRKEIDALSKEEAMDVAFKQNQIKTTVSDRSVIDAQLTVHRGIEATINIITSKQSRAVDAEQNIR